MNFIWFIDNRDDVTSTIIWSGPKSVQQLFYTNSSPSQEEDMKELLQEEQKYFSTILKSLKYLYGAG